MKYKITCLIQNKGKLSLHESHIYFKKIEHSNDVETLYLIADEAVMVDTNISGITSFHQLTVWKRNIFGGWVEVKNDL